jgi:hypothetical protein
VCRRKSQIQALDRTAPVLPMLPAVPARATHDYKRAGTLSLYAALDLATGTAVMKHALALATPRRTEPPAYPESLLQRSLADM